MCLLYRSAQALTATIWGGADGEAAVLWPATSGGSRTNRQGGGEVWLRRHRERCVGEAPVRVLRPPPPGPPNRCSCHRPDHSLCARRRRGRAMTHLAHSVSPLVPMLNA